MSDERKEKTKAILIAISKSIGIGIVEGGISSGIAILLLMINYWAAFGVFAIWLMFGWFSTYFIRVNTLEIIVTMLSGGAISFLIYYFASIEYWFISIVIGLSILFWIISFVTKIFIFPHKKEENNAEII